MKKILNTLIKFLYGLIFLIEKVEYLNAKLDENDIRKKIISSNSIKNLKVRSDKGFVDVSHIHKTQPYTFYSLLLENGKYLECADNHIIFTNDLREKFVKDLKKGDLIFTDSGVSKIKKIKKLKRKLSMCDLTIDDPTNRYYTNGILSHNTITASITILYYSIFETNKNILIAANIKKTTDEIISKIKDIYYYLPFWLKPGVTIWNKGEIFFGDTKCKIKTSATTKTAAIGNTIDLLYLDEFAHVPNNISEDFYRSILPTVESIENSKVIITSTPNGYNLFWRLLSGAEKPDGDPEKNRYASMRVYWYEVPGRFVTYLRMNEIYLEKLGITSDDIYEWVKSMGFQEEERDKNGFIIKEGLKKIFNTETEKTEIHIPNYDEFLPREIKKELKTDEKDITLSDYFRRLKYIIKNDNSETVYKLLDICNVSSWKEDAIKNIGSLEAFSQEYDLQFLAGSKTLFDGNTMDKIKNNIEDFSNIEFNTLNDRTFIPYDNLVWIKNRPDLFDPLKIKDYYIIASIDISEGLGGDYSVINFFRVMPKTFEEFPLNFKSLYDFFKLEQIGIYKSNTTAVEELAELAYLLFFEIFDYNKVGCVLEWNKYGSDFTNSMKNLFNGRNLYSSHIFFRYKHRQDAKKPSIGIKLRTNKNIFVKKYQKHVKLGNMLIHNMDTLREMTTFIKKDTASGYRYEADSGAHDDTVMTLVETSTVFDNYKFHDICNSIFSEMSENKRKEIERMLNEEPNIESVDYNILFNAKRKSDNTKRLNNKGNQYNNPYFNNNSNDFRNPYLN